MRKTIWFDSPGVRLADTAYIEQALRWAHEADPRALLFYNDYEAEGMNAKSDAIYKMAKDFKTRGAPLNGSAHSWIENQYRGFGAGLEFDSAYRAKPAYKAMGRAMEKR